MVQNVFDDKSIKFGASKTNNHDQYLCDSSDVCCRASIPLHSSTYRSMGYLPNLDHSLNIDELALCDPESPIAFDMYEDALSKSMKSMMSFLTIFECPYPLRCSIFMNTVRHDFMRTLLAWMHFDKVKHTFEATTQYNVIRTSTTLLKHYKPPFPALNVHWRNQPIAKDTVYSDTSAIYNSRTLAQIFVCTESLATDFLARRQTSSSRILLNMLFISRVLLQNISEIRNR